MKRLCVFCGSNQGARPEYVEMARRLGRALVDRRIALVYGGASVGIMGEIADAVLSAGGEAIGVIPAALMEMDVAHTELTNLHVVSSMHERKALMVELSDGFIALPGGLGTFEELFEVLTWAQLGLHGKPCGLLDVADYYRPLVQFLDHAAAERFVKPVHRDLLMVETTSEALLDRFEKYESPAVRKWIKPSTA